MHALIASPYMDRFLLVRPGFRNGMKIPQRNYDLLASAAASGQEPPPWLIETGGRAWPDLDIAGRSLCQSVLVRPRTSYGFAHASYELNLGCNYDCPLCYLGVKKFSGLSWENRARLLHVMRDAGVLWLQLTGGEPLIDKLFPEGLGISASAIQRLAPRFAGAGDEERAERDLRLVTVHLNQDALAANLDSDVIAKPLGDGVQRREEIGYNNRCCPLDAAMPRGGHNPGCIPFALIQGETQRRARRRLGCNPSRSIEPGRSEPVQQSGHGLCKQPTACGDELAISTWIAQLLIQWDEMSRQLILGESREVGHRWPIADLLVGLGRDEGIVRQVVDFGLA